MSGRSALSSRWFLCGTPQATAPIRLFCFPYAGGGASVYRGWGKDLPGVEVIAVQPPGREDRYGEQAYTDLRRLTAELGREIEPWLDRPAVFFGHSMGGSIAYQLATELQSRGRAPQLLMLSARPAPHVPLERKPIHELSDEGFVTELKKLAGTPEAVLENRELMDFLLPTLRADFQLCDTYVCDRQVQLEMPLVLFGGIDDATARREKIEEWRGYTRAPVTVQMFPGNHFFLQTDRAAVLAAIRQALAAVT